MADYERVNLREDVPDMAGANGVEGLAAHFASSALGLQHSGLSLQRLDPGARQPWGHRHQRQEEVYVVVRGGGTAKLGDDEVQLGEGDALRIAPPIARNFEAGPDGLELVIFGAPRSPEDNAGTDAEMLPGWWGDSDV